jgi:diguanylate cyclase (GGDEF)-like protein
LQIPHLAHLPRTHDHLDAQAKQALRIRRFHMSVVTYFACGVFAQVCALLGYLPIWLPGVWAAGVFFANLVFYLMIYTGRNLRLRDPSMTEAQLLVSMVAVMVLIYHTNVVRGAFLMLFPVPLLFGVLRLNLLQTARVAVVGVAGYALVLVLLFKAHPERVDPGVEVINLLALAAVMGFVSLMCAYISKIRGELSHSLVTIREMAQRDALTGVFNRRHLMETLEHEVSRCGRGARRGLVLCMIDLDHFKKINDTFGHPVGDDVLSAVGQCIGSSIRSIDYLARYGGEEFVVLLDLETGDEWRGVCERTRAKVEALTIEKLAGSRLSVSIGVAQYSEGETALSLLDRADKALYLAKANGRNCIRIAPCGE